MERQLKIFGTDVVISIEDWDKHEPIDIMEKMVHLSKYLDRAISLELIPMVGLDSPIKIRFKGIYTEEDVNGG